MVIEIRTVLIDEKKLTKSLFLQLPTITYPYNSEYKLNDDIIGYAEHKGTHLLIHREGKLYKCLYKRGSYLYCTNADNRRIEKLGDGWKDLEVSQEIFVTNDKSGYHCNSIHFPHIAFGAIYLPLLVELEFPPGFYSEKVCECIDPEIMELNLQILNKIEQIFLKA